MCKVKAIMRNKVSEGVKKKKKRKKDSSDVSFK